MAGTSPPFAKWALALVLALLSVLEVASLSLLAAITSIWQYNFFMDQQANEILAALLGNSVALDAKIELIGQLNGHIKHHRVSESAVPILFEIIRVALSQSQLVDFGFKTLAHLTKRLETQGLQSIIATQGTKTCPIILERLGDAKDRIRNRAINALSDFWTASPSDVEKFVRDSVLTSKSARAKEAGMQWVVKMHKEHQMPFKSFVAKMVDCLEDADGSVRDTAKATLIGLFQPLSDAAKSDLKKQLQQHNVRKMIVSHIYNELGLSNPSETDPSSSTTSLECDTNSRSRQRNVSFSAPTESSLRRASNGPAIRNRDRSASTSSSTSQPTIAATASEEEASQLEPIYIRSNRELEDIFRSMHPHFEGKETEQNWSLREKDVIRLRRITKGNAPTDYANTYLTSIRALLDGILKTVNSLRTTVTTNGCHLIEDIARKVGSGLDNMVEILLQALIKLCGGTKNLSAQNGNITIVAIFANVTYNIRLMQHIFAACQDKNVRPRTFATGWLKTLIEKHAHHKTVLEHANGLDLVDKCIKRGLTDANVSVRESMRPTYWAYCRVWPERAGKILSTLEPHQQSLLLKDASNPDPRVVEAVAPVLKPQPTRSTAATPRPSLKETIAARKKLANVERPSSAQSSHAPDRKQPSRPATAMAVGTLSSAPLRPIKPKAGSKLKGVTETSVKSIRPKHMARGGNSPTASAEELTMVLPSKIDIATDENMENVPNDLVSERSPDHHAVDSPRPILGEIDINHEGTIASVNGKGAAALPNSVNTLARLIDSGIRGIRLRSLDVHAFRRLQGLIKAENDNCTSSGRLDELLLALFTSLECASNAQFKAQVVVTIKMICVSHTKEFLPHAPNAICSLLMALSGCTSQLTSTIWDILRILISHIEDTDACIEAVLRLLESVGDSADSATLISSLKLMSDLLKHRNLATTGSPSTYLYPQLTDRTIICIANAHSGVRRAAFDLVVSVFEAIKNSESSWALLKDMQEGDRALLSYYLARKEIAEE